MLGNDKLSTVNCPLNNGFGQYQHFILQNLYYSAVDAVHLLRRAGSRLHDHVAHAQRTHERRVIVKHLKLPFGTRKSHGVGFASEHFFIGGYYF